MLKARVAESITASDGAYRKLSAGKSRFKRLLRNGSLICAVIRAMKTLTFALLATLSAAGLAQDSFKQTTWKPKEGQENVWAIEFKFQVSGMDAVFTGMSHRKTVKVNLDSSMEIEGWTEDAKVVLGGSVMDQPTEKSTVKIGADGKPTVKEEFKSAVDEAFTAIGTVKLPAAGAKVGDKWKLTDPFDRLGPGEAELLGPADFCGHKCLAFKVTYTVLAGGTAEGKVYDDLETGVLAGFEATFKKLAIAPGIESDGTATMKITK